MKITPSSSYTHLSGQDAVAILESSYGIAGSVDFLPSERDQNFKVTTEEKDQFVLKIASPFEEERLVNFQDEVLNFLIEKKLPFSLPTPVPDKSGQQHRQIQEPIRTGKIDPARVLHRREKAI